MVLGGTTEHTWYEEAGEEVLGIPHRSRELPNIRNALFLQDVGEGLEVADGAAEEGEDGAEAHESTG